MVDCKRRNNAIWVEEEEEDSINTHFVVRNYSRPLNAKQINDITERLKNDIINELMDNNKILTYYESESHELLENILPINSKNKSEIETLQQIFYRLSNVQYKKLPFNPQNSLQPLQLERLGEIITKHIQTNNIIIFNCGQGIHRSSVAAVLSILFSYHIDTLTYINDINDSDNINNSTPETPENKRFKLRPNMPLLTPHLSPTNILVINVPNKKIMKSIKIKNINGFKSHDITTTTPYTYVTLLSTESTTEDIGWIIQYSTQTLKELKRIQIGSDPHVYHYTNNLYAVSQGGNLLYKYSADILTEIDTIHINGAHGIFGNIGGEYLWVTDITSDDGKHSIYAIDLNTFTLINGMGFDAIVGNPHNVRSNDEATKLFIAHSAKDIVTAYDLIDGKPINGRIIFDDEGSVPFGIMNVIDG